MYLDETTAPLIAGPEHRSRWEQRRNNPVPGDWRVTAEGPRVKLKRLYPTIQTG